MIIKKYTKNNKGWSINMLKINNKSNESKQVNNIAIVTGNTDTYANIGVPSHTQYNNDVSQTKAQYIFDTQYNIALYSPTQETLVKSTFETIGEEPIIGHCITTQDLINIYAHGCIQGFYEEYCKLHTDKENLILGKVLSILGIEIWRNVECYGGIYKDKYFVSNLGNVKRLYKTKDFTKILKQYDCGKPCYLYVHLYHKGIKQNIRVHRLVALTFIGEPTEKLECCHSNTNSHDNRLFNLDFKTHSENMLNPLTQKKNKDTWATKAKAKATTSTTESASATTSAAV